jgi:hypothetical protein
MNTITTTASTNTSILAIDLGKYKSVTCAYDPAAPGGANSARSNASRPHDIGARPQPSLLGVGGSMRTS